MDVKKLFEQNRKLLVAALAELGSRFKSPNYKDGRAPKGRYSKERGKTRRGAKHVVGPQFHSRRVLGVSPAEYRRAHMGKTNVMPSYKIVHAAPKARNVVTHGS